MDSKEDFNPVLQEPLISSSASFPLAVHRAKRLRVDDSELDQPCSQLQAAVPNKHVAKVLGFALSRHFFSSLPPSRAISDILFVVSA